MSIARIRNTRGAIGLAAVSAVAWGVASVVGTGAAATMPVNINLSCTIMGQTQAVPLPFNVTVPDSVPAGQNVKGTLAINQVIPANVVQLMTGAGIGSIDIMAKAGAVYGGVATGPASFAFDQLGLTPPATGDWNLNIEQAIDIATTGKGTASVAMGKVDLSFTPKMTDGQPTQYGTITGTCAPTDAGTIFSVPVV